MTQEKAILARIAQFNRPHSVDKQTGDFLFQLYRLLWKAEISDWAKQRAFEAAADCKHSWRVICVSEAALESIAQTETAIGLRRAHGFGRKQRFEALFKARRPVSKKNLLDYFFLHDTCALVTSVENKRSGVRHWSPLRAVPEGILTSGSGFSVYARKRVDVPWAQEELSTIHRNRKTAHRRPK